jgi:transposase
MFLTHRVLSLCAWSAVRQKDNHLRSQFYQIRARRGPSKAVIAVAASILTAVYHMLKKGKSYQELGPNHFQRRNEDQQ